MAVGASSTAYGDFAAIRVSPAAVPEGKSSTTPLSFTVFLAPASSVRSINENSWSYFNSWWYGRGQNLRGQNVGQKAAPAVSSGGTGGDGPMSLGQISVQAEVSIVYALE